MPKLPVSPMMDGWHLATIQAVTFRPSANSNPMLEVEVTLESGRLTNVYVLVTTRGDEIRELLWACGENQVADDIFRRRNPAFELDNLIGRQISVHVYRSTIEHISRHEPFKPSSSLYL